MKARTRTRHQVVTTTDIGCLGTLKNSLYFFSNFRTGWEADTSQKMKVKMSTSHNSKGLDLQQARFAKTFQWNKREPLNPSQALQLLQGSGSSPIVPSPVSAPWGTGQGGSSSEQQSHPQHEAKRGWVACTLFVPAIPDLTRQLTGLQSSLLNCHYTLAVVWKPSELWVRHKQAGGTRG